MSFLPRRRPVADERTLMADVPKAEPRNQTKKVALPSIQKRLLQASRRAQHAVGLQAQPLRSGISGHGRQPENSSGGGGCAAGLRPGGLQRSRRRSSQRCGQRSGQRVGRWGIQRRSRRHGCLECCASGGEGSGGFGSGSSAGFWKRRTRPMGAHFFAPLLPERRAACKVGAEDVTVPLKSRGRTVGRPAVPQPPRQQPPPRAR